VLLDGRSASSPFLLSLFLFRILVETRSVFYVREIVTFSTAIPQHTKSFFVFQNFLEMVTKLIDSDLCSSIGITSLKLENMMFGFVEDQEIHAKTVIGYREKSDLFFWNSVHK
jgi:hypothetical protein